MNNPRYLVQIQFKSSHDLYVRTWDINESIKTISEARTYKSMIDGSVSKARIVDTVPGKVVETWV